MSWNYRVCTKVHEIGGRYFMILPVYYKAGVANSYGEQVQQHAADTLDELNQDYHRQHQAFGRAIIDLDNFPNEYKND